MKKPSMFGTLFLIAIIIAFSAGADHENLKNEDIILSWCYGNLSASGAGQLFIVAGNGVYNENEVSAGNFAKDTYAVENGMKYGNRLIIYNIEPDKAAEITKRINPGETKAYILDKLGNPAELFKFKTLNPLKVQLGDIDGNGVREIALCVFKKTEFHPVMAKRPFFYDLDTENHKLKPVWLGSRLTHPFDDYIIADVNANGMDEVISIDKIGNNKKTLYVYQWKDFGFDVIARSDIFQNIKKLEIKEKADGNKTGIKAETAGAEGSREMIFIYAGDEKFKGY